LILLNIVFSWQWIYLLFTNNSLNIILTWDLLNSQIMTLESWWWILLFFILMIWIIWQLYFIEKNKFWVYIIISFWFMSLLTSFIAFLNIWIEKFDIFAFLNLDFNLFLVIFILFINFILLFYYLRYIYYLLLNILSWNINKNITNFLLFIAFIHIYYLLLSYFVKVYLVNI